MGDVRGSLVREVGALFSAATKEDRQAAGERARIALKQYMAADLADPAPLENLDRLASKTMAALGRGPIPLKGMSDGDLASLNSLLPWAAMTVDGKGRVVGSAYSGAKRALPHGLSDKRHAAFNEVYPLKEKHVLELGCFEGIQTLSLLLMGAQVTAVDGRVENVLKTMARVWAYGRSAQPLLWDFERPPTEELPAQWDVLHHIGVLYHLSNPVEHLNSVLPRTRDAVLLDTHVAIDEGNVDGTYTVDGIAYRFRRKAEPNADISPFAGMRDHAKYLLLEDLCAHIERRGFSDVRVVSDRVERNGRRVTIWAFR